MSKIRSHFNLRQLVPLAVFVLVSLIILSPQLLNQRMIVGEDCWFHMNRAYEDMEQLKTGHFSYFLNLFSFNSSGRIVNGVYGPLGGYLEGLLLLIVKHWYRWEIINSFLALAGSGISIYWIARKLRAPFWSSILAGILYLTSCSFNGWVLNQNFDGIGAVLLPWFLLAGYRIFEHRFSPVKLSLLVTLMSQIHLMSAVIGVISLFISFILANCYAGRLKVWLKTFEAAGLTLLLTVNLWGSLLEIRSSNRLIPTVPYHHMLGVNHALYSWVIIHPIRNYMISEAMIFLVLGLLLLILRKVNLTVKFLIIQGILFLWLSSKYFPWAIGLKHYSMLASYIQFPERFLPIAIAALLLVVSQLRPKVIIIVLLIIMAFVNVEVDLQNGRRAVNSQFHGLMKSSRNVVLNHRTSFSYIESTLHSDNAKTFITLTGNRVPDYMPSKRIINKSTEYYRDHPEVQNLHGIIQNRLRVRHTVSHRDVAELTFNSQPGRWIKIPFVKYAHTKLWLNHQPVKPRLNRLNVISVRPTQRHNVLQAQYQPSHWYELLALAEVVTWLSLIINEIGKHLTSRRV